MSTVLGLIAFVVFIAAVVAVAAGITWVVVRFSPAKKPDGSKPA
ncbi:MAG TPA: hypothetical protein VE261_03280 [Gaiellaceae bacterium]|nr:hypothetical protein [Gaiellaceae bacterium]